jgi:hypothetical protein
MRAKTSRSWRLGIIVAGVSVVFCAAVTAGRTAASSYSSIAEKDCRKLSTLRIAGSDYASSRVCAGRGGYRIFVDEEDLRETLTVGRTMRQARREPAASDRFGAFNGYDDTAEWRSGMDGRPYALIVGWSHADADNLDVTGRPKSARLLVVIRLPPGPVCKVAVIDRAANADANALARKAADDIARNFKCETDEVQVVGKSGPATNKMPAAPTPDKAAR